MMKVVSSCDNCFGSFKYDKYYSLDDVTLCGDCVDTSDLDRVEQSLGGFVKEYRDKGNMTIDELSAKSGLSKGFISKVENNKQSVSRIDNIESLAKGLDVRVMAILNVMRVL